MALFFSFISINYDVAKTIEIDKDLTELRPNKDGAVFRGLHSVC